MRRYYRSSNQSPILIQAIEHRLRFTSLIPSMETFSRQNGIKLILDLAEHSIADPQLLGQWRTANGLNVSLSVSGVPGNYLVKAMCWTSHSLVASKDWRVYARDPDSDFKHTLLEARTWAESVIDPNTV